MTITFFNEKPKCGKSTLTCYTAMGLAEKFSKNNSHRVFIFDTARNLNNSIAYKKKQEEQQTENPNLIIEHIENYSNFETKKIELGIQENDVVFFDLQGIGEEQLDFLINSNFIFIVSDASNEFEEIDRDIYFLVEKIKNELGVGGISKIFLIQNKIKKNQEIIYEFEEINCTRGLGEVDEDLRIENLSFSKKINFPLPIQKFYIDVWKNINDYKEQIILN